MKLRVLLHICTIIGSQFWIVKVSCIDAQQDLNCTFYFQTQQSDAYTNFLQSFSSFVKDVADVSISVFVKKKFIKTLNKGT